MAEIATSKLLVVAVALMGIGTLGFYYIDGMVVDNAEGDRLVNAFYCCVMTLTTVGYGDICPSDKLSHLGRMFIMLLSFLGLGMFCGPIMDFASLWTRRIPGGVIGPGVCALGMGILLFTQIEDMSALDAAYLTIITGTTVGYGDLGPSTDLGRISTSLLAIIVINVIGGLLEPARDRLSQFCMAKHTSKTRKKRKKKKKA